MVMDQQVIDGLNQKYRELFRMIANPGSDIQSELHQMSPLPCFQEAKPAKCREHQTTNGLAADTTLEEIDEETQLAALLAITRSRSPLNIALIPVISTTLQKRVTPRHANRILRRLERLKLIQRISFSATLECNRPSKMIAWEITKKGKAKLRQLYQPSDLEMLSRLSFDDKKDEGCIYFHLILAYHARLRGGRVIFPPTMDGGYAMSIGFHTARYRIVTPYSTTDDLARLRKNLTGCRLGACAGSDPTELVDQLRQLGLFGMYTTITVLRNTQSILTTSLWTDCF